MSFLARSCLILPLLALLLLVPTGAAASARTISWSGYVWDVRPPGIAQEPGPNDWSDSASNVRLEGSDLLLSIVKGPSGNWTSPEVESRTHLGYGTYRWVVATDLSALDADEVLGMFTYGGSSPSNNEIDIEPSHWGDPSNPTGSATVWQNANRGVSLERDFSYSAHPPYVNQFTWAPGRIDYLITDATGATLLAWTVTTGVPTPSTEVPVINYWRFNGIAPAGVRTIRISSFAWAPLGQTLAPVPSPPANASPPPGPGGLPGGPSGLQSQPVRHAHGQALVCMVAARGAGAIGGSGGRSVQVRLTMRSRHFTRGRFPRDAVLRWSATGAVRLNLVIRRWVRGHGFVRVGGLRRSVRRATGRIHLPARLGARTVGPGSYSVRLRSAIRCSPGRLTFTVA
ncbi:MAG TPA: hypothetical protein VJ741_03355 [Solirubrobacteraceae bacterium]|nr:hypothetical protein [Solirubrobacteraceae bacterium]